MVPSFELDRLKRSRPSPGASAPPQRQLGAEPPNSTWRGLSLRPTPSSGMTQPVHMAAFVGRSEDPVEREADRIAERVMGGGLFGSGERTAHADRVSFGGAWDSPDTAPLPPSVRAYFEPRFGRDLSTVRVHTGEAAAQENDRLGARAFASGQDIWLGRGESTTPSWLLAHELAHVVHHDARGVGQAETIRRKEDWDFTPAEYGTLTKGGGTLTFDADSSWFPEPFKKNLLTTLKTLLDPARKEPATAGVNITDFYHGHIALKGALPADLDKLKSTAETTRKSEYKKALGEWFSPVTTANLPAFGKAVTAALPSATSLLEAAAKLKNVVVIYHTYESSPPAGVEWGSPKRNFITPLGGSTAPYSPPDIKSASSWMREYSDIYQFSFLVDGKGAIHVRPGSTKDLSTVTGTPQS